MESEIDVQVEANRGWVVTSFAILMALMSVGLYLAFFRDPYSEVRSLIEQTYSEQRPAGGRLDHAVYVPFSNGPRSQPNLGKAQLLLLRYPESDTRQRMQALIYIASGNWQKYVEAAGHFSAALSQDAGVVNNLGVSYLALAGDDPTCLLKAIEQFERARTLNPQAVEPRFNLVLAYRKLHLHSVAERLMQEYASMDAGSAWQRELAGGSLTDNSRLVDELKQALEASDIRKAERIFEQDPDLFRRAAMQYGSSHDQDSMPVLSLIASQIETRYGDKTISAMLAPLLTDQRDLTLGLRQFVTEGAELFVQGNLQASLEVYDKAEGLVRKTDSLFDQLWIDVNRADTQVRAGQFDAARAALQRVVSVSQKNGYLWLSAKALSIYGSTVRLTSSYGEMIRLLSEADRMFTAVRASHDRVRVLYYLASYQYGAGDQDEALKLALECLRLTDDGDSLRLSTFEWLIGFILYNKGMTDKAVVFETESVEHSKNERNPGVQATTATTLAQLYESISDHKHADQYVHVAEDAFKKMPAGFDQTRAEQWLGIVKARIELNQKRYAKAELLLERNLDIYSRQPFQATWLKSQSLALLARAYAETGRTADASRRFNEAIDIVENDDHYLQSEKLRIKFDDERRDLYDSAIEFEFNKGAANAAWTYLQKYRSKLFIEFLAQFDPNVGRMHAQALDRSSVQTLITADVQILEYALLKNRLLIWFISKDLFTVRSVTVPRGDIEAKVQDVLSRLRNLQDVDPLLTDLGRWLVEPVADLLDANRTVVIVPDRALHGLPFGVLRRPGKSEYLIQDFPIIVSPNLTHLMLTAAAQPRRDSIIGFGSQNGESAEVKELGALVGIYPQSHTFVGPEVDKARFLAAVSKASVFHYAGHSVIDAVDPLRSSILLDGNRSGPNSVTAVDLAQQRLANNAVVVLSSCDSSIGNSRDGIGVRGLTSAFLIGGAGSVVGSLWPVEASSTADLMIRFHRAFANSRMPVAKALREAQLTFLQSFPERSHPYYWSGFVVTGNFSALR